VAILRSLLEKHLRKAKPFGKRGCNQQQDFAPSNHAEANQLPQPVAERNRRTRGLAIAAVVCWIV